jgi:hypothetical protein
LIPIPFIGFLADVGFVLIRVFLKNKRKGETKMRNFVRSVYDKKPVCFDGYLS